MRLAQQVSTQNLWQWGPRTSLFAGYAPKRGTIVRKGVQRVLEYPASLASILMSRAGWCSCAPVANTLTSVKCRCLRRLARSALLVGPVTLVAKPPASLLPVCSIITHHEGLMLNVELRWALDPRYELHGSYEVQASFFLRFQVPWSNIFIPAIQATSRLMLLQGPFFMLNYSKDLGFRFGTSILTWKRIFTLVYTVYRTEDSSFSNSSWLSLLDSGSPGL